MMMRHLYRKHNRIEYPKYHNNTKQSYQRIEYVLRINKYSEQTKRKEIHVAFLRSEIFNVGWIRMDSYGEIMGFGRDRWA